MSRLNESRVERPEHMLRAAYGVRLNRSERRLDAQNGQRHFAASSFSSAAAASMRQRAPVIPQSNIS